MTFNAIPHLEGWLALEKDDYLSASQRYTDALKDDPTNAVASVRLGWALYCQGRYNEALAAYSECNYYHKDSSAALSGMGLVYCALKDYHSAVEKSLEAIAQSPENVYSYLYLSYIYRSNRDYQKSKKALQAALRLEPGNGDVHYELGAVARSNRDYAVARQHYTTALQIKPKSAGFNLGMGIVLLDTKEYLSAREAFLRALEMRPNWPYALLAFAIAETKLRHFESASSALRRIIEISPGMIVAYRKLIRLNFRLLRWREGLAVSHQFIHHFYTTLD